MAKREVIYFKCIVLMLMLLSFFYIKEMDVYGDSSTKTILVLNSYNQGFSWTDDETTGILNVFKNEDEEFSIAMEYMDWKNYASDENLELLKARLSYKYKYRQIDAIITTDDAALKFVLENRAKLFSDAPVVFCGVNDNGVERILKGQTRVTGVIEKIDPEKTVTAALEINPNIQQIYLVFDKTESGMSTGILSIDAIRKIAPSIRIISLNDSNIENILKKVSQTPKDSIVINTTYFTNAEGELAGFEYFSRKLSKNSSVPVYSLYDYGIGNGAMGGSMISGRLQGEEAAKMVLKVLQGTDIMAIPFNRAHTTRYIFDYEQLQRFGIDIGSVPEGSEIVNKPSSYYNEHKGVVITSIILFILAIVFILILVFYLKKISRMKEELYNNNMELTALYENLTTANNEVKLLNAELEMRVSERTAELQGALNELESYSYTVSHDLKSPLRAVDGYAKILLEDLGLKIDEDSMAMLKNISTISRETIEMINTLLKYSTISRAVLSKEEVNIEKKISEVFNELRMINPERDISLIIETKLPNIFVDKVLFRQLLQNILSNAIKFTKNKEKAVITIGCTRTPGEYIFYVKDNGAGFDMTYSEKLFHIFQRMHTGDEFEGSGIGLVTVKNIIEKHGGRVWIEGQVDVGTVVYFTLPFRK